ncbi:MAG TPA: hypothetical protein VGV59_13900 [Pyrinomonadaceae bacterium]|nr:hypothetical protein [Pyrinomonadaceae bacterium]
MKAATRSQVSEETHSQSPSSKRTTGAAEKARRPSADALAASLRDELGADWLPRLYRERILTKRTRSHRVPLATTRAASVEVQHTLLGIELKVGRKRLSCPDLATARYLAVFARAGCAEVAVPYDITQISRLADDLESSWQRMLLLAGRAAGERGEAFAARVRAAAVKEVRREITEAGAGTPVPQFNQNTKQRPTRD